jgi:4-hydroxybenzoate polyprenyltransferase
VAPAGAWIAQTGRLDLPPLILGAGVICWVAGFDLIYATQDIDFDRQEGLHSLVVSNQARVTTKFAASAMASFLDVLGADRLRFAASLGATYYATMLLVAAALVYEHRSASKQDLIGTNRAFFQSNAFVSTVFVIAVAVDCWL